MTADQALQAARHRDVVRVSGERLEGLDSNHRFADRTGKISELLGPRWYGRGEDRAILELDPDGELAVVPLELLEAMR